jgi:hypothetical protein
MSERPQVSALIGKASRFVPADAQPLGPLDFGHPIPQIGHRPIDPVLMSSAARMMVDAEAAAFGRRVSRKRRRELQGAYTDFAGGRQWLYAPLNSAISGNNR